MEKDDLDKIIYCFNIIKYKIDSNSLDFNREFINRIYKIIGQEKTKDFKGTHVNVFRIFMKEIKHIVPKILDSLSEKDRKYFLDKVPDFIKYINMTDDDKIKLLEGLDVNTQVLIVQSMEDDEKKIEALDYFEDVNCKLDIIKTIHETKRMYALKFVGGEYRDAYQLFTDLEEENVEKDKYTPLSLPSDMTIGMEIEVKGENHLLLPTFLGKWQKKSDWTLGSSGVEIVSTVMHDNKEDVFGIKAINKILRKLGMEITEECAGHIHIGADYIKTEEGFKELLELWGNAEKIYFLISNRPGELPRKGVKKYAYPISFSLGGVDLENAKKDEFVEDVKKALYYARNTSINLMNINEGRNTIEFRLSNGTLDGNTWIENIRLYGRTVRVASELGEIVKRLNDGEELKAEERRKLELREKLKADITLDEKMDILMQILFDEEERGIYQERYRVNKELEEKEHKLGGLRFGKVDFKKVYDGVEIPERIISKFQDEIIENQEQR